MFDRDTVCQRSECRSNSKRSTEQRICWGNSYLPSELITPAVSSPLATPEPHEAHGANATSPSPKRARAARQFQTDSDRPLISAVALHDRHSSNPREQKQYLHGWQGRSRDSVVSHPEQQIHRLIVGVYVEPRLRDFTPPDRETW